LAGFYLAVNMSDRFVIMEAFDTWRHPGVSFEDFQNHVKSNNSYFASVSGQEATYTTFFGNVIHYKIWDRIEEDNHVVGSKILRIDYGDSDKGDTLADAGNDTGPFLSGTILNSSGDGIVEIHNPSLGTTLTLDWTDPGRLARIAENGDIEQAGPGYDVWVDFEWTGPSATLRPTLVSPDYSRAAEPLAIMAWRRLAASPVAGASWHADAP
jgi:hypothetical protein